MILFKKTKIVFFCFIFYIKAIYQVRYTEFNEILFKLENRKNGKQVYADIDFVFAFERFISKTFRIKKCLISSICLFHTFKYFGIDCHFFIGINKGNDFKSHAWVETKNKSFLKDPSNEFIQIYKI